MRKLEGEALDGLLVVMLTYGPGMNVARALAETRLPVCLVNTQPVGEVTDAWDMGDLTYNQGIHGAQDTANALVRSGRPFGVVTGDWRSPSFVDDVGRWSRAAAAVTRWRRLKVAVFGYAMNGMGDIRVDTHTLLTKLGPRVDALAPGALRRAAAEVEADAVPGCSRTRTRASRSTRGSRPTSGRTTRACNSGSSACSRRAATAGTRRTSARSPTTAASRGCRSPPRPA